MAQGARPAFLFLVSPDWDLSRSHLEELLEKYPSGNSTWEKLVFWGDEDPGDRFFSALGQGGLFVSSRLALARQAQAWDARIWKRISRALGACHESVWPIFSLECAWEKGKPKIPAHILKSPCWTIAEKKGWVWRNPGLSPATLGKYAEGEARKLGLSFSGDALAGFCGTVAPNAAAVDNELKKLALACGDGRITRDMLNDGAVNPEADAFACIQKMQNGNIAEVWKELAHDQDGRLLFFLVALMARELRILWQLDMGAQVYLPAQVASVKKRLANVLGAKGIGDGFAALADAEWQVKSGRLDTGQALEALAIRMMKLFGRIVPGQ